MQTRKKETTSLTLMNDSMLSTRHSCSLTQPYAGPDAGHGAGDENDLHGHGVALVEVVKPELKHPRRYQVVILNDDYTPMEFVIEVLLRFFGLNADAATQLMLQVHHHGRAGVGSYSKDVAETKAAMVVEYAQQHEHPLLCQAEPML